MSTRGGHRGPCRDRCLNDIFIARCVTTAVRETTEDVVLSFSENSVSKAIIEYSSASEYDWRR